MALFQDMLARFHVESVTGKEKKTCIEWLTQLWLRAELFYASHFCATWLCGKFPFCKAFVGQDTRIDPVARTTKGMYWAIHPISTFLRYRPQCQTAEIVNVSPRIKLQECLL